MKFIQLRCAGAARVGGYVPLERVGGYHSGECVCPTRASGQIHLVRGAVVHPARGAMYPPFGVQCTLRSGCDGTPHSGCGGTPCSGCGGTPCSGLGGTPRSDQRYCLVRGRGNVPPGAEVLPRSEQG